MALTYRIRSPDGQQEAAAFVPYGTQGPKGRLDVQQRGGQRVALAYQHLLEVSWQPEEARLMLEFTTRQVEIMGQGLELLYEALLEERVAAVIEQHAPRHVVPEGECFIERIAMQKR